MKTVTKLVGIYTLIGAAAIFSLAGVVSTASALPSPYASADSNALISGPSTNWIYFLSDSSNSAPAIADVANMQTCSIACYTGAPLGYGSAHANAGGNVGVYSWVAASDGSSSHPYINYNDSGVLGQSVATISNFAVVQSSLDPITNLPLYADGTPVQLSLSLRLDGYMNLSASDLQKASASGGGFNASSGVDAAFFIMNSGGTTLTNFQASVVGHSTSAYDDTKSLYIPENTTSTSWSLTSNYGDNLGVNNSTSCDGAVSNCSDALSLVFNTGLQTVTLDTTIGETLDLGAYVQVADNAYGATASSLTDFSNGFGVNLSPVTSGVTLALSQAQVPLSTVPLPASLWLYLSGIAGLALVATARHLKVTEEFIN